MNFDVCVCRNTVGSLVGNLICAILPFTEKHLNLTEEESAYISHSHATIRFSLHPLHSAVMLYSMELTLGEEEEEEEKGGRCALMWLGTDLEPTLVTNFANRYELASYKNVCAECDYADPPAHLVSSRNSPSSSSRATVAFSLPM